MLIAAVQFVYRGIVMKFLKALGLVFTVFLLTILFGPRVKYDPVSPELPSIDLKIDELETYIVEKEGRIENLKPRNASQIIWADSIRKTPWSIVYLHGFSASPMEGNPTHKTIAEMFGMNLYLPRIAGHGIDSRESFSDLTPEMMINSAKEALVIGKMIGERVILMSCSTGGTYSIYLAAYHPDLIDALVLYSPNIRLYNKLASLVTGPWGLELARAVEGDYRVISDNIGTEKELYTTSEYRIEGVLALQRLLEETMTPATFEKVIVPYYLGYYYKDVENQDKVVSTKAMQEFSELSSTPDELKRLVAFPNVGNHVITSSLHSQDYEGVIESTVNYFQEVLEIQKK